METNEQGRDWRFYAAYEWQISQAGARRAAIQAGYESELRKVAQKVLKCRDGATGDDQFDAGYAYGMEMSVQLLLGNAGTDILNVLKGELCRTARAKEKS